MLKEHYQGLGHIAVYTADMDRSIAFYETVSYTHLETWPGMMPMEGEALDSFYAGLSAIATKQCLVQMAMISASGDEIALVEVENSGEMCIRDRSGACREDRHRHPGVRAHQDLNPKRSRTFASPASFLHGRRPLMRTGR